MNSYELATNSPKCKIVTNCCEIVDIATLLIRVFQVIIIQVKYFCCCFCVPFLILLSFTFVECDLIYIINII